VDWQHIIDYSAMTSGAGAGSAPAAESVQRRLGRLAFERVPRPQPFFQASPSGKMAYGETVGAFLVGLPNAALQMAVRCLEVALQEQYQAVEHQETDGDLAELIHWAEGHLRARAPLFQRFEALRQLAHRHRSVDERELLTPLSTIRDVTGLIVEFYPLVEETILQPIKCPLCGDTHTYAFARSQYYLGNIVSLQCERSRIAHPWLIDWI
jgi:hypothetical protein